MWYLYIIECANGAYYTGITKDLAQRLEKHNSGKGAKYTRTNRPVKLVYHENHKSESEARKREAEIKKWRRDQKENLIRNTE